MIPLPGFAAVQAQQWPYSIRLIVRQTEVFATLLAIASFRRKIKSKSVNPLLHKNSRLSKERLAEVRDANRLSKRIALNGRIQRSH